MALTLPTLTLSSGASLSNPILVIQDLNSNGSTSISERIQNSPAAEGETGTYELVCTNHEGEFCAYYVLVFANKIALTLGKPAVDYLKEGHTKYLFNFNKQDPEYVNLTIREAAYAHLKTHPDISAATEVLSVNF